MDDDDDIRPTKTRGKVYSSPGNKDPTSDRYSPGARSNPVRSASGNKDATSNRYSPVYSAPEDKDTVSKRHGPVYSAPGNRDPMSDRYSSAARYSPAFTQPRHDVIQVRQPTDEQDGYQQVRQDVHREWDSPQKKSPRPMSSERRDDFPGVAKSPTGNDKVVSRTYAQQRNSPLDLHNGPTYSYQNGFGGGSYDDRFGVGDDDPDVRRRRGVTEAPPPVSSDQRPWTDGGEVRYYRSTHDERADTPQSGRLSQAAMMVREMYEDGEFNQEVAVTRGSHFVFFVTSIFKVSK